MSDAAEVNDALLRELANELAVRFRRVAHAFVEEHATGGVEVIMATYVAAQIASTVFQERLADVGVGMEVLGIVKAEPGEDGKIRLVRMNPDAPTQ
jgi:hypothetical protein